MRIIFETRQNFSAFLAARLIFVTVLLGVAAIFQPGNGRLTTYAALFAANALLSIGGWEAYKWRNFTGLLQVVALTLAVVMDTLVLYYTGRAASIFLFLYFFSIGSAGLLMGIAGSLWTFALCTLGVIWLEWQQARSLDAVQSLRVFLYGLNFLLTAALAAYFHSRFRARELKHRATLGELEQTRLDTQAILDSISTGVVVLNPAREVLYSNPAGCSLLGLAGEAERQTIAQFLHSDSPLSSMMGTIGEQLVSCAGEVEIASGESTARTLGYSVSPLRLDAGHVRGHILLLTDLTPMKAAERVERERERLAAVGMLSRDLAHEIRNPLATVRGCVEMMKLTVGDEADRQRYLDLALKESDRLNDLLRDFLTFARLDSAHKQSINLAQFVRQRVPQERDDLLVIDRLPAQMNTECDPDQLGLVVDAILLSLAEWSEGRGEIRLETNRDRKGSLRFLLTEKTIPTDYKTAVFQPFSSVNRASHGLALPTALRAVHAHGGKLTLETEAGVGTWFELNL